MLSKATIKYIQSLQHKKFRDEHHAFIAEGPKLLNELIQTNIFECEMIYAVSEWASAIDQNKLQNGNIRLQVIEDFELLKISNLKTPNLAVGVFKMKIPQEKINVHNCITLVLDDINDPGNLGTIIRTADWFGVKNIVCSMNTVDCYNPKVVQSTMSSLARVNLIYTNIEEWLLRNNSVRILATTLNGASIKAMPPLSEAIVIIGNEANGIANAILDVAHEKITIPKIGHAESLNAAVATSIVLYELTRN